MVAVSTGVARMRTVECCDVDERSAEAIYMWWVVLRVGPVSSGKARECTHTLHSAEGLTVFGSRVPTIGREGRGAGSGGG